MRQLAGAILLAAGALAPAWADAQTRDDFRQDFDTAWRAIADNYAYFDAKATSWADIPKLYADDLERVSTRDEFVALLERVVDELYDPHAQLNTNLATSPRLVPSGTDLWAEWRDGQAVITDVRAGSEAERAGVRPNDAVVSIGGAPIVAAVDARLGRSYPHSTAAARDWGLRAVLAGRHNTPRRLQLRQGNKTRTVNLGARDQYGAPSAAGPVTHSEIAPGIGYIRFNDSLGDDSTVVAFDRALDAFHDTRGLILDLRDTPSGGNSTVARGILGRFVTRELPYQRHEQPAEERDTGIRRAWLELVTPRRPPYTGPVAVLVGHWTGSMGEGIAIGFDATGAGTVVGTAMAGLLGATDHIALPRTGIGLNLPTERLYHVEGTPREAFRPKVLVNVTRPAANKDPFLAAALRALEPPPQGGAAAVRREIEQWYAANRRGFLQKDVAAIMALRTDDFHTVTPDSAVHDRAEMERNTRGLLNGIDRWITQAFDIDSLEVSGDLASAIVHQHLDRMALRGDGLVHHVETWVTQRETWRRTPAGWKLYRVDSLRDQRRLIDGKPG